MSKSDEFRRMHEEGMTVAEIAKATNSNYAFVYGVIERHCQKTGSTMRTTEKGGRAEEIRQLWRDGFTPGEIAKQMNANYTYVWGVCNKLRKQLEQINKEVE
jgi:molybdenum-dependent DNA-binding transcriptional regulator ModE